MRDSKPPNANTTRPVSQVMFVLDVTQSMSAEIKGTKASIIGFIDTISKMQLDVELGLTWFRDIKYDKRPGTLDFDGCLFTSNPNAFIKQVSYLKASGGGGNPYESSKHGMWVACNCFTQANTRRFVVLVTDQRPYPDGEGLDPSVSVVAKRFEKQCVDQVYFVIPKRWSTEFEPIRKELSAKVFNLPSDGRSPEVFGEVVDDIGRDIVTYLQRVTTTSA